MKNDRNRNRPWQIQHYGRKYQCRLAFLFSFSFERGGNKRRKRILPSTPSPNKIGVFVYLFLLLLLLLFFFFCFVLFWYSFLMSYLLTVNNNTKTRGGENTSIPGTYKASLSLTWEDIVVREREISCCSCCFFFFF